MLGSNTKIVNVCIVVVARMNVDEPIFTAALFNSTLA
jgi:hypothetical protein